MNRTSKLLAATAIVAASSASATELEVMHWWTSGGEAAAVQEFAAAFDATGNTWVDAAIAGGESARAVMVSRLTGGDPMGAFQFNHGRQAEELIEAGLLRDITDIAEAEGWKDIVNPSTLLNACTVDGRIYCAPVNIHSWQSRRLNCQSRGSHSQPHWSSCQSQARSCRPTSGTAIHTHTALPGDVLALRAVLEVVIAATRARLSCQASVAEAAGR